MANLKEIRTRISSVASTMQITSAMKMVSAAKLKRAQNAVIDMRPYANKLKELLENVSTTLENTGDSFTAQREAKKVLLVVVTSNRGLCGPFNANVIKAAVHAAEETHAGKEISFICIGKRGAEYFAKNGYSVAATHNEVFDNLCFDSVAPIAARVMNNFLDGAVDHVDVIYNQFKNAAVQSVEVEQFLPVEKPEADETRGPKKEYIFEPTQSEIIDVLIPKSLRTQMLKALLDSYASEHGARMTAMHKATDNASSLKDDLSLAYNQARQAAITNEILEIVGGAEALSG